MSGKSKAGSLSEGRKSLQPRASSFNLRPGLDDEGRTSKASLDEKKAPQSKPATIFKARPKPVSKKVEVKKATSQAAKPQYDKIATKKFDDMLDGDLTDLPPLPCKSMVKIFLSSTFSDMRAERNILAREAYPRLREYFTQHGLDFQVVDMRWGVTEDSQNDHSVEKLCLLEVANCQKASRGPNFVVLSGNRYGFRPIPIEIEVGEFDTLKSAAAGLNLPGWELLDQWYKLDTNAIPHMYILQPIRSKFTFFADFSPCCEEPRKKDTADWWKTFEKLQILLRKSAEQAMKNQTLSASRCHQYFLSVTECEIQDGILTAKDVDRHCLVYQRQLAHLHKQQLDDTDATRFIDIKVVGETKDIDMEVATLKEDLISNKIPNKLSKKFIKKYTVDWMAGGVDPTKHVNHQEYLDNFCIDFMSDVMGMVEQALDDNANLIMMSNYYSDYDETIHHLKFCETKCESFCGQENILKAAKTYILDESCRRPFVIHAQSGAGKTSIMAMIMKNISSWLKDKSHLKLIRFLGTTPKSNNIYDVLFSVLGQLADASDVVMSPINYRNIKNLIEFTPRFFRQVANAMKQPVIILLDSVDQLYPTHKAYLMEWLPKKLPQNVKLIISTLPEEHGILDNIRKRLFDPECYIEVPLLPEATGKLIVDSYFKANSRTLTKEQEQLLLSVFRGSPSPLFLKLLLDEARKWKSYTELASLNLASTVKEAINKLFETLENKFGYALVSHALGYITVGLTGLTEFEIEDVLSCDDLVLNDVYKYHDPPIPGIVRIPPVLWARIRYDIKDYLVERISHGKNTLNWYHRQFIETAQDRYTSDGKDVPLHNNLTTIYLQDNGVKRTITLKNRKNLTITDADRQVVPQLFSVKNHRKLACLPYHVIRALDLIGADDAKSKIFCNFEFLCTKIAAFSLSKTIGDLTDYLDKQADEEITILQNFLSVSKENLSSPVRFAACILAYIQPEDDHNHLKALLAQAEQYLISQTKPLLIPTFPCLAPRANASSALEYTMKGFSDVLSSSTNNFFLKTSHDGDSSVDKSEYAMFNSATQDLLQIDLPNKTDEICSTSFPMTDNLIYFVTDTALVLFRPQTGKSTNLMFTDIIPKWKPKTQSITGFTGNSESTNAILIFSHMLALVDLQAMKTVQTFKMKRKVAVVKKTMFSNTESDPKIVAIGKIVNSSSQDQPQGPANQSFVCVFVQEEEYPVKVLDIEMEIDSELTTLADQDKLVVMASKAKEDQVNENNEKEEQKDGTEDSEQSTLFSFSLDPLKKEKEVQLNGAVQKMIGNPDEAEVTVLTSDGCFHLIDMNKGKVQTTVALNYPVKNFEIIWDASIGLLCSHAGNITFYDLKNDKNLGAFTAHGSQISCIELTDQQCLTLGSNTELKSWSMQNLISDIKNERKDNESKSESTLLEEMNVSALNVSTGSNEIVTCSEEGFIKMWDTESQSLLRRYNTEMTVNEIIVLRSDTAALFDKTLGKVSIMDMESGKMLMDESDLPSKVLAMTTNAVKTSLFIVSAPIPDQLYVNIVNLQLYKISKTISLQKGLTYVSIDLVLSKLERYLILRTKISEEEYESVITLTKKTGSFGAQPHRHKFTAIDLSQGNGGLMPCYRQLSKIPTLGICVEPYRGNTMMITTRRWVLLWDIPTGKCDQKVTKSKEKSGMFYRPHWAGKDCKGTIDAMVQSPNTEFLCLGSEDGYMFIYDTEFGLPRGKCKPATKHNAEVTKIAVSPDNVWVASTCRSNVLKLWDSSTGKEQLSVRVDAEVQTIMFMPDSTKLVLYTGTQTTRVLVFTVHDGKPKETDEL